MLLIQTPSALVTQYRTKIGTSFEAEKVVDCMKFHRK
jgi:hypothetical protein